MSKKRTYAEENENLITTAIENAGTALENASSSTLTEYIQENVEYRASAGLKETIIREELSNCCKWCHDLAGEYEYGTEPNDIYRRHDNCKCIVLFKSAKGKYQDVWSKKQYDTRNNAVQGRIKNVENILNKEYNKQTELLRITEYPASEITKSILRGEIKLKLSQQNYDKHVLGTRDYERYRVARSKKGLGPQSIITIDKAEAQEIINKYSGTGIIKTDRNGKPLNLEKIKCDKVIGEYWDKGEYHETRKAIIVHSKRGSHIYAIKGNDYD